MTNERTRAPGLPMRVPVGVEYALYAVTALAATPGAPRNVASLSADGMSTEYLKQVLARLRAVGLLHARPGPGGGYWLVRPPDEISVGDIVRALDALGAPTDQIAARRVGTRFDALWAELGAHVSAHLDRITIARVVETSTGASPPAGVEPPPR